MVSSSALPSCSAGDCPALSAGRLISCVAFACLLLLGPACTRREKEQRVDVPQVPQAACAEVLRVVGSASILNRSSPRWKSARAGARLYASDVVKTEKESEVEVSIGDQQILVVSENSLVSVNIQPSLREGEKPEVVMAFGRMFCRIRKLTATEQLQFRTPTALASIRGTALELAVASETGESSVRVVEGAVAVRKREASEKIWKAATAAKAARAEMRDVNLGKAGDVLDFMATVSYDPELAKEKELREKIRTLNRELVKDAFERGVPREEAERMVAEQTRLLEEEAAKERPPETIVAAGRSATVSRTERIIFVSDLGPHEMGMLTRVFGEDRIQEALSKPRDSTAASDSMSLAFQKMLKMDLERRAKERLEKKNRGDSNQPPTFTSVPAPLAYVGNKYVYQVTAEDADTDAVMFSLINAPAGMTIDPSSGVVCWTPKGIGAFKVKIGADDNVGGLSAQEFRIQVREGMLLDLKVSPKTGTRQTEFRFDASGTRDKAGPRDSLSFRWDFDGNGTWDVPGGDSYSPATTAKHTFVTIGQHTVQMEVRGAGGITQSATAIVTVEGRPPKVDAGPDRKGNISAQFVFEGVVVDPDQEVVSCRWDFDGDGKLDWQARTTQPVSHRYPNAGVFQAVFSTRIRNGKSVSDAATVSIIDAPPVATAPGQVQTLLGGGGTTLEGKGHDPDGSIKLYEWDFEGDGRFDWNSTISGVAIHSYANAGTFNAVFRITSNDGRRATATTKVTVLQRGSAELMKALGEEKP